jgi:hypothetical protein
MLPVLHYIRPILAALLLLGAALFVLGAAVERSTAHHDNLASASQVESHAGGSAGEGNTESTQEKTHTRESTTSSQTESSSERIFGLDLESNGVVLSVVIASVVLSALVWLVDDPAIFLIILVFGLSASVFDLRETIYQIQEGNAAVAWTAALVTLLHFLVAGLAGYGWWYRSRTVPSVAASA